MTVLGELAVRGYKVAVVSNFDSRLTGILREHELEALCTEIVFSTGVGAAKPDSGIFEHTLAKLDTTPDCAVHVGDSHDADYVGARSAGLEGLLLMRSTKAASNSQDHVIGDLEQLLTWLVARG